MYKARYINSPSYTKRRSRADKLSLTLLTLVIWAAVIIGGVWAN